MNRHTPRTQFQIDNQFSCPICSKQYYRVKDLRRHLDKKVSENTGHVNREILDTMSLHVEDDYPCMDVSQEIGEEVEKQEEYLDQTKDG